MSLAAAEFDRMAQRYDGAGVQLRAAAAQGDRQLEKIDVLREVLWEAPSADLFRLGMDAARALCLLDRDECLALAEESGRIAEDLRAAAIRARALSAVVHALAGVDIESLGTRWLASRALDAVSGASEFLRFEAEFGGVPQSLRDRLDGAAPLVGRL